MNNDEKIAELKRKLFRQQITVKEFQEEMKKLQ